MSERKASGWLQSAVTANACPTYPSVFSMAQAMLFIVVWYHALSLRCTYSTLNIRASSSPPGYPCAKFHFYRAPHCWSSPRKKLDTQWLSPVTHSLSRSLTQLI